MPNTREIEHPAITHGAQAPSCTMVIFGAAGDLTKRLLLPALYNLARTELLPANFALIGVDRLEMSDDAFRQHLDAAVRAFAADKHYSQTLDEARALMWIRRACAYRVRVHCDALNPQDADARLLSASVGFAPTDAGSRSGEDEL
jgi:hypothetical protein